MEQERRLDMGKYGLNVGSAKIYPKSSLCAHFMLSTIRAGVMITMDY